MGIITILSVAVGLAMDAFAVSVAAGIRMGGATGRQTFRLAFHFGFFQFIMPILGWTAGNFVEDVIGAFDHWIAFTLLGFIGGRMILESFDRGGGSSFRGDPTRGLTLVGLSIATSIDALAVGLGLGVLHESILYPSMIIGLVAGAFSVAGMELGRNIGVMLSRKMEAAGGVILIVIGTKILLDHTILAP